METEFKIVGKSKDKNVIDGFGYYLLTTTSGDELILRIGIYIKMDKEIIIPYSYINNNTNSWVGNIHTNTCSIELTKKTTIKENMYALFERYLMDTYFVETISKIEIESLKIKYRME